MTTTQQAIDTKYDYYLALRDEKLKTLFSPAILGWARQNGLNTFENMVNYAGTLDFSSRHLKTLNGLDLLKALTYLNLASNQLTDVGNLSGLTALTHLYLDNNQLTNIGDLSGLTALTYLYLYNNQLTDVGNLSGLTALTYLHLASNQLTDVGNLSGLTALTYLNLYNNQLTDIGDLSGLTALTTLYLNNNNFATAQVDKVLADMHTAYDATVKIATINLSGANMGIPTGGVNNADYVYLTNAGVSVTIRTV